MLCAEDDPNFSASLRMDPSHFSWDRIPVTQAVTTENIYLMCYDNFFGKVSKIM